jgi:hypothetical protein
LGESELSAPKYRSLSRYARARRARFVVHHPILGKEKIRKRVDIFGIDEAVALNDPKLPEDMHHDNIVDLAELRMKA